MLQRTAEWHADRAGRITASRVFRIVNGGPSAWNTLMDELAKEREFAKLVQAGEATWEKYAAQFTGNMPKPLAWGIEHEEEARELFWMLHGHIYGDTQLVGSIVHPEVPYLSASPDWLLPEATDVGGSELKSPYNSEVHQRTLSFGMPQEHMPQVQCQMACAQAPAWLFVSYDPRQPPELQLYIERIEADRQYQATMLAKCAEFWRIFEAGERCPLHRVGDDIPIIF